tara:strand:- start:5637 stop:6956 length:1320 start_codon:yes stop_codon:yes gene_type:complete
MSSIQGAPESSEQDVPSNQDLARAAQLAHRRSTLLLFLPIPIVVLGGFFLGFYQHQRSTIPPSDSAPVSFRERVKPLGDMIGKVTDSVVGPERVVPKEQAEAALFELRQVSLTIELAAADNALKQLNDRIARYDAAHENASSSEQGRRLATDSDEVNRFVALASIYDPIRKTAVTLDESLDRINRKSVNADSPSDISELVIDVRKLKESIVAAKTLCSGCQDMLTKLLQQNEHRERGQLTLAEAIAESEQHMSETILSASNEAKQEAESQTLLRLKELRESGESLAESASRLSKSLDNVRSGETVPTNTPQSRPAVSIETYRASIGEIRTLLKPFISPGYAQPASRDEFKYLSSPKPMSLALIDKAGALEDSQLGLETLFRIGGLKSVDQHNDRPLGAFPKMSSTAELNKPDVIGRVRRAQYLLNVFGDMLIRDGMLQP